MNKLRVAVCLVWTMHSGAAFSFIGDVASFAANPVGAATNLAVREITGRNDPALGAVLNPQGMIAERAKPAAAQIASFTANYVKAAARSGPLAFMNSANPQFLQLVMGIKALQATGAITSLQECRDLSRQVADEITKYGKAELGDKLAEINGRMSNIIGNAACSTANGFGRPLDAAGQPTVSPQFAGYHAFEQRYAVAKAQTDLIHIMYELGKKKATDLQSLVAAARSKYEKLPDNFEDQFEFTVHGTDHSGKKWDVEEFVGAVAQHQIAAPIAACFRTGSTLFIMPTLEVASPGRTSAIVVAQLEIDPTGVHGFIGRSRPGYNPRSKGYTLSKDGHLVEYVDDGGKTTPFYQGACVSRQP